MATFMYHVLVFTGDGLLENEGADAEAALNSLGTDGWDIVGIVRREAQDQVVAFMRKTL
jgi:hypothetical protein